MKHKILISLISFLIPFSVPAQTINNLFTTMPDSIIDYLPSDQRTELIEDIKISGKKSSVIVNAMGDSTSIVNITKDYLDVKCNKSREMEMKLLPRTDNGDTILCMVNTYYGPAAESTIDFYDLNWNKLDGNYIASVKPQSLISKPDTMSEDDFSQLKDMLDPLIVKMSLSPKDTSIKLDISIPEVPSDKKTQLKSILLQRELKWNGKTFN